MAGDLPARWQEGKRMKTVTQKLQELQEMGWVLIGTEGSLYSFNKLCTDDVDVIVSIRKLESGYDVFLSAEHRCSGPSEAVVATATSIEEALNKTIECCKNWDNRHDAEALSYKWRLI